MCNTEEDESRPSTIVGHVFACRCAWIEHLRSSRAVEKAEAESATHVAEACPPSAQIRLKRGRSYGAFRRKVPPAYRGGQHSTSLGDTRSMLWSIGLSSSAPSRRCPRRRLVHPHAVADARARRRPRVRHARRPRRHRGRRRYGLRGGAAGVRVVMGRWGSGCVLERSSTVN